MKKLAIELMRVQALLNTANSIRLEKQIVGKRREALRGE